MPITSFDKDLDALTMTVVADFPVPVRRLWDAYVDPRQLEKFWGPVDYPATFTRHDVAVGGRSVFYMTSPEGELFGGYWDFTAVDEGRSFVVRDGFADPDGTPKTELPTTEMTFAFTETDTGSRLTTTTQFGSLQELEQVLEMGMEEGLKSAMSQIDDVVTDLGSFAADRTVDVQTISDTTVRISRVIRGTPQQVWDAHHDPELMRRWMLGPDGWRMTDCTVGNAAGDTFRYAWEDADGENGFALTGDVLESEPIHRTVFTETMEGIDGPPTRNEETLTPVDGGTLLTLLITYADAEMRDTVLGTGMADGMEASYARLESDVLTPA